MNFRFYQKQHNDRDNVGRNITDKFDNKVAVSPSRSLTCYMRLNLQRAVCLRATWRETRSVSANIQAVLSLFFQEKHITVEMTWGETEYTQPRVHQKWLITK